MPTSECVKYVFGSLGPDPAGGFQGILGVLGGTKTTAAVEGHLNSLYPLLVTLGWGMLEKTRILCVLMIFTLVVGFQGRVVVMRQGGRWSRRVSGHLLMQGDDRQLMDDMANALGTKEDLMESAEIENKQLMKGLRDVDTDPNIRANTQFLAWLDTNGVWVKQESTWGRAPHPLVISSKTEDDGESCGRGLLARESMTDGELMMTIPLELCLTKKVAKEKLGSIVTDDMDEYIAIALLLMSEKGKGAQSLWKAYFDVLPDAEEVYPAFIWSEAELALLEGSPTFSAAKSLQMKLKTEFELLKSNVFERYPSQFPSGQFSFELFQWAFIMLFSRAARLTSKLGGEELALVPYADLMNHNPYSNTYIDAQRSGVAFISKTEEVAVYADRPYKKFEQVFINYGEKGNADLLLLYGFALERNPFNAVDISVGISKEDPLYVQKRRFLDRSGRGASSVRFPLQGNRYPSELVDFLRLLLVESEDLGLQPLEQVDFNEPLSPSLERRVLTTMVSICESYLEQYPQTVEEDEKLMGDKGLFKALTRQQRMAVKLRASEKRILKQTIRAIKEELVKLPRVVQVDSDGKQKIATAGRSFDEVNAKSRVSQAKFPMDFVDIKGSDGQERERAPSELTGTEGSPPPAAPTGQSAADRRRARRSGRS